MRLWSHNMNIFMCIYSIFMYIWNLFIIFIAIVIKENKFGVIIALLNFSTLKYFLFTTLTLQVRNLFPNCKKVSSVGRSFLKSLPEVNYFKPTVWAQHKRKAGCYGVSLAVQPFVRPLYLYTKLSQLKRVEDGQISLKDVIAMKINRLNDHIIQPCVGCQCYFGFISYPPFGNCAEYIWHHWKCKARFVTNRTVARIQICVWATCGCI